MRANQNKTLNNAPKKRLILDSLLDVDLVDVLDDVLVLDEVVDLVDVLDRVDVLDPPFEAPTVCTQADASVSQP